MAIHVYSQIQNQLSCTKYLMLLSRYHVCMLICIPFADAQYTSFVPEPSVYDVLFCLLYIILGLYVTNILFYLRCFISMESFSSHDEFVCLISVV
jgi:hypothetical protein